ncbi:uncharacterized protein LOC118742304 [Rhagoletis pomonella]|uniref:uncharacterized protein LOC118742304 n=1 Tax=Rhagoletis pomonella TaxID=28610 RepID=UPI00177C1A96|nr:uncharacterized protein LOC118742304 [Rhagoletis pomonella]XP_036330182.1 uncharacterized protein LOC118742304 [Rhagoletis pomonella]
MFLLPNKFEQSLRASPIQPATPAQPGTGLKPEFHRGCTGKAHACGTLKSRLAAQNNSNPPTKNGIHTATPLATKSTPRKNSISSETISDSGSENSASWHSHDSMITQNEGRTALDGAPIAAVTLKVGGAGKPALAKKPTLSAHTKEYAATMAKALKAVDAPPRSPMMNVKRALSQPQRSAAAARTASPAPTALQASINGGGGGGRRMRLHSDGDHSADNSLPSTAASSMTAINSAQQSTFERTQKYRSFRVAVRKSATTAAGAAKVTITAGLSARPPWNSGAGVRNAGNNANMSIYASPNGSSVGGSGGGVGALSTRTYRNSFRRSTRECINWQAVWERSLALRGYGANSGVFKNYDEAIKQQV